MRLRSALALTLVALAASVRPVHAGDDDDPLARDAKSRVEYFDKYASKAADDQKYGELVMDLATLPHALTVERIGRILLKDRDEEHQLIAAAALGEYKEPVPVRDAAGKTLVKGLEGDGSDDVIDTCVDSIGKIGYRDAVPVLCEMVLSGGNPYVLLTTVRALGRLNDRRALPALLQLWERHPVGYSWETGEVKVDTGAAGTADQEAAEAQWNAKYGSKMGGKGKKPPLMFKVYVQELIKTIHKITGDPKIEKPDDLRAWMEAHREELKKEGIEIPRYKGPSKKADEKDKGKGKGKGDEKGEGKSGS